MINKHYTLQKTRQRCFRAALALSTAICGLSTISVQAQTVTSTASPPFQQIDGNGVDILSGTFHTSGPGLTIGNQSNRLDFAQSWNGQKWRINILPISTINRVSNTATVSEGEATETFTFSGGAWTTGGYSTLVCNASNICTYTKGDGTVIVYDPTMTDSFVYGATGMATSKLYPDGEKLSYGYTTYNFNNGGTLTPNHALTSISSNRGYVLNIAWALSSPGVYTGVVQSVSLSNAAYSACTPAAVCTNGTAWPTVNIATTATTSTMTNAAGRVWRYTNDTNGNITGIKRPSSSAADNVTITYDTSKRVTKVVSDEITTNYAYSLAPGVTGNGTTTITDGLANKTVVNCTITLGGVTWLKSITDPLNRITGYTLDGIGRVSFLKTPEGNTISYTYPYGLGTTPIAYTKVSKTPGTPANIVTSAFLPFIYPCNPIVCTKPSYTKDALGNQTDYTYDSTTGLVTSITGPAPSTAAGAVRPQTRFSYTQYQAYYKNAGGAIVASGAPISLLTGTSTCQTLAGTIGTTAAACLGLADEVKTTISYGPQTAGTPNNLLPVSITRTAGNGSVSATTSYTYDVIGNIVSVDGPLAGTTDTAKIMYNADRQVVGAVGPAPGGNDQTGAALKNRARRTTYNADGQVTKAEVGTVNSQSDADWLAFNPLQTVDTIVDVGGRTLSTTVSAGGSIVGVQHYSYDTIGRLDCTAQRLNPAQWGTYTTACTPQAVGTLPDRISKNIYDAASQIVQVQSAIGISGAATTQQTYTPNGLPKTLTDPNGNLTTYSYDGFDRLSKTQYPSPSTPGTSSTTDFELLSYDAASNIKSRQQRDATSITFNYDFLNRVTLKHPVNPTANEYDVNYGYDTLGRSTSITSTLEASNHSYDALGRTLSETSGIATKIMSYDLAGNLTQMKWPDGNYISYDHLITGEVSAIRENGALSGVGVLASYTYDNLGNRRLLTRGNGTVTAYSVDPASRLTGLSQTIPANPLQGINIGLSYTAASQIGTVTRSNDMYAYTGSLNVNRGYTVNGLNQYSAAGGTAFSYDLRGNLITSGSTSFSYTSENRLAGNGTVALTYGPESLLLQSGITRFDHLGDKILTELDGGNHIQRRYVYGHQSELHLFPFHLFASRQ